MTARDALVGSTGAAFLARLHQALQVAKLHDLSNAALDDPLEMLRATLAVVIGAQGSASVKPETASKLLFLNDRVVRSTKQGAPSLEPLVRLLAQQGVGELRFERSMKTDQLRQFLAAYKASAHVDPKEACRSFRLRLEADRLPVMVLSTEEMSSMAVVHSIKVDDAVAARLAYARTLALLQTFTDNLGDAELARYFWRKLVRGMHSLQALATRARHDLLAVTAIRDVTTPALHHAVNTSILAVLLGQHAGIPKTHLGALALGGLLHGLGRPTGPSPAPARDAYRTVAALLGVQHLDDSLLLSALVAFQFEARRGHPETRAPIRDVHPLAQIVAIAEAYDSLVGGPERVRPDKAMSMLLQGKPRELDMALLGTLAGMLGTFPPGSAVEIDTGDIGIVCEPNPENPNHPIVAIVRDREGRDVDGGIVDLSTRAPSGRHAHNLKKAVDPVKLGLKVPERLSPRPG